MGGCFVVVFGVFVIAGLFFALGFLSLLGFGCWFGFCIRSFLCWCICCCINLLPILLLNWPINLDHILPSHYFNPGTICTC